MEKSHPWPLMADNVTADDLRVLREYLSLSNPRLTHGPKVLEFEAAWADWVGVDHSVMVNSGSSANDLTLLALRELHGEGEVIMSPLGWVSDISAVVHAGLQPVFVDIDPNTLGIDNAMAVDRVSDDSLAVLAVHILGLNCLSTELINHCRATATMLIEDVCESHGATFDGSKCGSLGDVSNFSFYYAHHLTTIEGGAICTDNAEFADVVRMMRSHGLLRESRSDSRKLSVGSRHRDLNPEFIFEFLARNNRPTELSGVLGLNQLPRLDSNVLIRRRNFKLFVQTLDPSKFRVEFELDESSNYSFIAVLREPDFGVRDRVETVLRGLDIEFRRGLSGGGNLLRQPFARRLFPDVDPLRFPEVEHVHHFGWYIGNHPGIDETSAFELATLLNGIL